MFLRALVSLVVTAALAGCATRSSVTTSGSGHGGRRPEQVIASLAACQKSDRVKPVSDAAGARHTLVPGHPLLVQLCRYRGLNGHPRSALVRTRIITNASTAERLAHGLDALPMPSTGTLNCPADFGDAVIAVFGYRTGLPDPVTVGLSGCAQASNGHFLRLAGPGRSPVLGELDALSSR